MGTYSLLYRSKRDNLLVYTYVFLALLDFVIDFSWLKGFFLGELFSALLVNPLIRLFLLAILFYNFISRPLTFKSTVATKFTALLFIIVDLLFAYYDSDSYNSNYFITHYCFAFDVAFFFLLRDDIKIRILDSFIRVLAFIFLLFILFQAFE